MEDEKIVELFWNRSETAIEETDKKYYRLCKQIALNILSCNEDAEECVNDTYFGVWNSIPIQKPRVFSAYICRITRNIALKKFYYNTAQKRNSKLEISLTELEDCIIGGENVEQQYEAEILAKSISKFLRTLNYEQKNIFLRRYWFCDSITDISIRFNISNTKVKSILFRVRSKLKTYLEKEGFYL